MSMDRIEKEIEIVAPRSRVWRALTDYMEFGKWFGVTLKGAFVAGQVARGTMRNAGCGNMDLEFVVKTIEPERYFAFTWHPFAVDATQDYAQEEPTLVEFTLSETPKGTLLRVVESGFDKLPAHRRDEAFRMNEGGWSYQFQNITTYVKETSQQAV